MTLVNCMVLHVTCELTLLCECIHDIAKYNQSNTKMLLINFTAISRGTSIN